jgi:hypothetical protein
LLVACLSNASTASSRSMPDPSSSTTMRRTPAASQRTAIERDHGLNVLVVVYRAKEL